MSQFTMPSLGADMESAVLMEWLVSEGDRVSKGEIIAEVETSKGVIEVEVFESGVIEKLLVEPETECAVGEALAVIRAEGGAEPVAAIEPEPAPEPTSDPAVQEQSAPEPAEPPKAPVTPVHVESARIQASPAARRRAAETGVDLATLKSDGVIQLRDVEAAAERPAAEAPAPKAPAPEPSTPKKAAPADAMRQAIAAAMSRSNAEIPHYYLAASINMTPALNRLEERNAKRSIKERVLPAALLIHAVVAALKEVPELNGFWRDGAHEISEAINPGFAIALRQGDLGVESVYGVIYPPQISLVGLGRIVDSPWAEGDALCVRKVMQATLAGDHRATDGRTGARLLDKLKYDLEHPKEWL